MANKVAVASVIAAVGVVAVIGTIAAVTSSKKGSEGNGAMSSGVKLGALCSSTLYPAKCEESLKPVVNDTANPEDILRAALNVAMDEVAAAFERSAHIGKDASGNVTKSAMEVCKKLLEDAREDLRDMARLKPEEVVGHVKDLRVWLSGVMTYIYTCADGFDKPELKEAMDKVLQNSTELSSNALAIITRLGELLPPDAAKKLNASSSTAPAGPTRRLLGWQMNDEAAAAAEESGGRRLLAVDEENKMNEIAAVTDASRKLLSETVDEVSAMSRDAHRRLLGLFSEVSNSSDPLGRRLLSMSSTDDDDNRDVTDKDDRRRLLSVQADSIADMSAEVNRHLLAAEVPEELAGRRHLLSTTLMQIVDMATGVKGQLDAMNKTTSDPSNSHSRVLATDLVGTFDEIDDGRSGVPGSDIPEWMPAHQRRLLQMPGLQKPNVIVAQDGSGNFKTINEAVNGIPKDFKGRYAIYVKAGDYKEYVTMPKDVANVFMYGDGPTKTRVIGDRSNAGGFATMATRTFSAEGNGFICKSMGFVNTAGPEAHQAVALHVQGDMSVFFNCRFEAYQDTLYVHANRQFFRNCEVLGTVDFIFGNSAALFQNCLMTVRKPMDSQANMVTAHGRTDPNMPTGIVLQACRIVPEDALFPTRLQIASYLGRPWKEFARTVVMESTIGDLIKPEGWAEWMGDFALKTLYYAEYANTGPGAGTSKRVAWPGYRGVIGQAEATHFTPGVFLDGMTWLKSTGVQNVMGFTK
ncbi:hypothetical protein EJB05_21552 [Eragrostis curvula]|uniref:pectinesterase n=1 Tax=Eragrostis curvula TaxID=38414 RepID=A0A5J9TY19_9POAL|nr:hypothetical protein EJB05_39850 [Eragrostis curvula]TVU29954.1 hypothetical protein EJB05_21552 [Eragrostis curvula]